jgi:hypothetical protein
VSANYEEIKPRRYRSTAAVKEFSVLDLISSAFQGKEGVFKVKLFTHAANKGESASAEIYETLANEVFTHKKGDSYSFKAFEFPQIKQNSSAPVKTPITLLPSEPKDSILAQELM